MQVWDSYFDRFSQKLSAPLLSSKNLVGVIILLFKILTVIYQTY